MRAGESHERNKSMKTPIFKGNQIYMNFVRPHSALDGATPAQAGGVGVEGGWMGLIKEECGEEEVDPLNFPKMLNFT